MPFFTQFSRFYYFVALLCSAKNTSIEQKMTIFRMNQKSLNLDYALKLRYEGRKCDKD